DRDIGAAPWSAAADYLRGAADVVGLARVGVYGEYDAMAWAARDRVASYFFQTYAWSGGRGYVGNHVEQYRHGVRLAGGVVDLCRSKQPKFGQWPDQTKGGPLPASIEDVVRFEIRPWTEATLQAVGRLEASQAAERVVIEKLAEALAKGGGGSID